ncbi:MAG: type IV pilus biogenesis protein PilM [Planctomycetota bacterium]
MNALLNKLGTRQSTVAIDFGAEAVRVSALHHDAGGAWVVRSVFTLPSVDLAQGMPASVVHAFAERVRSMGLRGCRARVTISAIGFQTETATLPTLKEDELAASARFEAIGRLGVDETDTIIRHHALGGTGETSKVLLLTLPMLTARHAAEAVVAAGLHPESVEHAALAALSGVCQHQRGPESGLIAVLHVEPRAATVMLHRDGQLIFLRALRGEWTVLPAQAPAFDATMHEGDIPLESQDSDAGWRWSSLAEETLRCLRQGCGEAAWPERMFLSGAAACDRSLADALQGVCGMPVSAVACRGWAKAEMSLDAGWAACLGAATHDRARVSTRRAA